MNVSYVLNVFSFIQLVTILEAITGSVVLDSITFDKIIKKFGTVLVKFDIPYPYGEKHQEFEKVAKSIKNNDILMAEVGVQQYGDKENVDLIERYGISATDFPVLKLFLNSDLQKPIDFVDEFKADSMIGFIRKHSGIKISINTGLEEFDDLAERFVDQKNTEEQKLQIIEEVKQRLEQLTDETQIKLAKVYIKIMEKMVKIGNDFIESEIKRVNDILKQNIKQNQKQEMKDRLNILYNFSVNKQNAKNEL